MNLLQRSVMTLAESANGNPIITTVVVCLFYLSFMLLEASIEEMIFGKHFSHFLDPLFIICFISYAAYAVYGCAMFNSLKS
jgi:hypothetical protein